MWKKKKCLLLWLCVHNLIEEVSVFSWFSSKFLSVILSDGGLRYKNFRQCMNLSSVTSVTLKFVTTIDITFDSRWNVQRTTSRGNKDSGCQKLKRSRLTFFFSEEINFHPKRTLNMSLWGMVLLNTVSRQTKPLVETQRDTFIQTIPTRYNMCSSNLSEISLFSYT